MSRAGCSSGRRGRQLQPPAGGVVPRVAMPQPVVCARTEAVDSTHRNGRWLLMQMTLFSELLYLATACSFPMNEANPALDGQNCSEPWHMHVHKFRIYLVLYSINSMVVLKYK